MTPDRIQHMIEDDEKKRCLHKIIMLKNESMTCKKGPSLEGLEGLGEVAKNCKFYIFMKFSLMA